MRQLEPSILDLEPLVQLVEQDLAKAALSLAPGDLKSLLTTAFQASLEVEEGRSATFALALVPEAMLHETKMKMSWAPIIFSNPEPLTIQAITKLAPAIDYRQTRIMVTGGTDCLLLRGLVRTNTFRYREEQEDLNVSTSELAAPLTVVVPDSGSLEIWVQNELVRTVKNGVLCENGVRVFAPDSKIGEILGAAVPESQLDGSHYLSLLRRIAHVLSQRRHGGTILILSDVEQHGLSIRYVCRGMTDSLKHSLLLRAGESLDRHSVSSNAESQLHHDASGETERRAIRQMIFDKDTVHLATDLASVDGALVISRELQIIGFGARIREHANVQIMRAVDAWGRLRVPYHELHVLGMRHNSAADYCYAHVGAIAITVSQDGIVSCFLRETAHDPVVIFRPVAV